MASYNPLHRWRVRLGHDFALRSLAAAAGAIALFTAAAVSAAPARRRGGGGHGVVIPFPSPPSGAGLGHLHTLPALQCTLTCDGTADADESVGGEAGRAIAWETPLGAPGAPLYVPPGECAPPVGGGGRGGGRGGGCSNGSSGSGRASVGGDGDSGQPGNGGGSSGGDSAVRMHGEAGPMVADMVRTQDGTPFVEDSLSDGWPLPAVDGGDSSGLAYGATVARLLSLQLNSLGGHVRRVRGNAFDVLVVSRTVAGRCGEADTACAIPGAVDTVRGVHAWPPAGGEGGPSPWLTVTTPGGPAGAPPTRTTRLVRLDEAIHLSLGRAVMADARWLAVDDPRAPAARLSLRLGWEPPPPLSRSANWHLGDRSPAAPARSAAWMASLAALLCTHWPSSFVTDARACAGVRPGEEGGRGDLLEDDQRLHLLIQWAVEPPPPGRAGGSADGGGHGLPLCAPGVAVASGSRGADVGRPPEQQLRPGGWDAGEVAPTGMYGKDYLHRQTAAPDPPSSMIGVGSCVPPPSPAHTSDSGGHDLNATTEARHWAKALRIAADQSLNRATRDIDSYDRRHFRKELPLAPASNNEVILSVIVVFPELAALLALALAPRRDRGLRRDRRAAVLMFLTGLVSLTGIGVMALAERAGGSWRVAAMHEDVGALRATLRSGFDGAVLYHTETLMVLAPVGYRPRLLVGIAAGLLGLYLLVAVACGVRLRLIPWWGWVRAPAEETVVVEAAGDNLKREG